MRGKWATLAAYAIFAATGLGVVLPGTLLSSLLTRWSLSDQRAGFLFFLFFIGSSCGALLSRGRLGRSVARGCLATAAGASLLAVSSRTAAFAAMLLLGLGLGIAMTSISLMQSRREPATRTAEMARLNLTWALGAALGPALLLRGVAQWTLEPVLYAVAGVFAAFGMAAWALLPHPETPAVAASSASAHLRFGAIPLLLLALVPLATGIESSVGGWLATYSGRDGLLLNQTISTVTCYWAGLLLSRLVQSHRAVALALQGTTLRFAPWLMSAGLLLLLLGRGEWPMLAGAMMLGCGVGPLFPLLLALLLDHGEAGNIVFLAAGIGASSLPLVTGLVSGWSGSLAIGLTVPLAGAVAMGVLAMVAVRPTRAAAVRDSSG